MTGQHKASRITELHRASLPGFRAVSFPDVYTSIMFACSSMPGIMEQATCAIVADKPTETFAGRR
jgi:hypothetical protein